MKPFLILQIRPQDETSHDEFEAILKHGHLTESDVVRMRIEVNGIPDDLQLADYSGIILGGGPFCVSNQEKSAAELKMEKDLYKLLDEVVEKDFPFLGACIGIGILGNHQNCEISKDRYSEPVGAMTISKTEAGERDALLKGVTTSFRAFVGHKEACTSWNDNIAILASSLTCPVQMFRVKNHIYATQFHPELDSNGLTVRVNYYKHHGYFPPESAEELIEAGEQEQITEPMKVLRNFVEKYQTS